MWKDAQARFYGLAREDFNFVGVFDIRVSR